jgi:hypothetical protein
MWFHLISKIAMHGLRHRSAVKLARSGIAILLIYVGQPTAFSVHPFDIDSWKKNGNDAQLESVLGILADICEQDPKKLAEEVRSMSGPVKKHMCDRPGTGLLEAWEAEADGRFKGRSEAVSKALYAVRAIHRGTGSLESRFHKGREMNSKKHMLDESMQDRLQIYVCGPQLEKFCTRKVVKGKAEYIGSSLCKRSQAQYRMKYGSKVLQKRHSKFKVEDEANIPPRIDKGQRKTAKPTRMLYFLQQKAMQAKEKQTIISPMDNLVMKKLSKNTKEPSDVQLKAKMKAEENLVQKRKFIEEMMKPQSEVLNEKNKEIVDTKEKAAKANKFHMASLHLNALQQKCLVPSECKIFVAQREDWTEHHCKSLSVEHSVQKFVTRRPDKKKLWFSQHTRLLNHPDWQQLFVDQKVLSNDMAVLGAVVFGGYLVDETWVKKSTDAGMLEKELLVEPIWKLRGSINKALELTLDTSLCEGGGDVGKECKLLLEAKPDRILVQEVRDAREPSKIIQEESSSRWTWRNERSQIRTKESWVVCSDQARVEQLTKRKEKKDEEITKLEKQIADKEQECETAIGAVLLEKRQELKVKQTQLKEKKKALNHSKGVPIALPEFLNEVVLPNCYFVH